MLTKTFENLELTAQEMHAIHCSLSKEHVRLTRYRDSLRPGQELTIKAVQTQIDHIESVKDKLSK